MVNFNFFSSIRKLKIALSVYPEISVVESTKQIAAFVTDSCRWSLKALGTMLISSFVPRKEFPGRPNTCHAWRPYVAFFFFLQSATRSACPLSNILSEERCDTGHVPSSALEFVKTGCRDSY